MKVKIILIKKKTIVNLLNLLWWIVVFWLCTMSNDQVPKPGLQLPHIDKIVHAILFGGIAYLCYFKLTLTTTKPTRTIKIIALGIAIVYGTVIEIIQPIYFARGREWMDLIADGFGALLAIILATPITRMMNKLFTILNINN